MLHTAHSIRTGASFRARVSNASTPTTDQLGDRPGSVLQPAHPPTTRSKTASRKTTRSPVIVIAIGQCGVTVAHDFFSQFGTQPHLYPEFFVQVNSSQQDPPSNPSPSASSRVPHSKCLSGHDSSSSLLKPFVTLSAVERDARIRRTLSAMLPTISQNQSSFPPNSQPDLIPPNSTGQYIPRAILLDTEPKVVTQVVSTGGPRASPNSPRSWRYHPKCTHWRAAGAANNWAYGYYVHGHAMWQTIVRGVRAQVKLARHEDDDRISFLVLHSVAGGTGSGVGTYVTEQLRREHPTACIVNQVVWPFSNGEIIVQHYNVVLTLSHLKQVSNQLLVFFNDHLHQICTSRLGIQSPGFDDLNPLIAHTVKQLLTAVPLQELVASLAPTLLPPFATMYYVPQVPRASIAFTSTTWRGLLKPLKQMALTHCPIDEQLDWRVTPHSQGGHKVETMLVVLKGEGSAGAKATVRDSGSCLNLDALLLDPRRTRIEVCTDDKQSGVVGIDKWAAIVCTSSAFKDHLANSLQAVVKMHACGAYSYQYAKYGLSSQAMESAIADCYQLLTAYQAATGGDFH